MRPYTLAAVLLFFLSACGTAYIAGSSVPDTEENREIWDLVMHYRKAVETRDADKLLSMVSRSYYENSGTTDDPTDDYGYEELRERVLADFRDNVLEVQLRLMMRRIQVDGDHATADYEYHYNFRYVEGGVSSWKTKNDYNRLEFVREGDQWLIRGGL